MKIIILTPTIDGKLTTGYVSSLINTVFLCKSLGINISHQTFDYDPILQHSRNVLLHDAVFSNSDAAVWIDADIEWNPNDFIKIIQSEYDVIGGTYRIKQDYESYSVKFNNLEESDIQEVDGLGFGFIKTSIKALRDLWESSNNMYADGDLNLKNIFEIKIKDGYMYSEDIVVCEKLNELGYKVYLDKNITCNHIGVKKYIGNFNDWSKNI